MFKCSVCDEVLEAWQCVFREERRYCEVYVCCPRCGGECERVDVEEAEDGEEEE